MAQYELGIKDGQILIISPLKQKVRQRIDLANIHAKEAPKYKRDFFCDDIVIAEGVIPQATSRDAWKTP